MNVLILADYRTPKSGNFIASILELGLTMRKSGNKVVYLFPENNQGGYTWSHWIEQNQFEVILFNEKQSDELKLQQIKQIVKEYYIDIIHSHFGYLNRLLLTKHRQIGKQMKLVFHDHMDFSEVGNLRKQKLSVMKYALLYRIFDAYVISVMQKKDKAYRLAGKRRHRYVANGLSLQRAEQDTRTRDELRAEIGVSSNEKLALFLGWDLHRKGLDVALKGIAKYRADAPNLKLGVIGAGRGKPSERTELFLRESGCNPNEDWIIYLNDYEDIFALNRAVDVYISASRAEAFSYGILEAISQNNPVVVSDIEGTSWSKEYNKCVPFINEDANDCSVALKTAVAMGKSESNYKMIISKYSNDVWCKKIIGIYEEIMK